MHQLSLPAESCEQKNRSRSWKNTLMAFYGRNTNLFWKSLELQIEEKSGMESVPQTCHALHNFL